MFIFKGALWDALLNYLGRYLETVMRLTADAVQ